MHVFLALVLKLSRIDISTRKLQIPRFQPPYFGLTTVYTEKHSNMEYL